VISSVVGTNVSVDKRAYLGWGQGWRRKKRILRNKEEKGR
jgi:hypothetical protein